MLATCMCMQQVATAKWREAEQPHKLVCQACLEKCTAHYMHPVGFDKRGQPVIYSSYILIEMSNAATTTKHMIQVRSEQAGRQPCFFSGSAALSSATWDPAQGSLCMQSRHLSW